jgi:hypothetical protein
MLIFKPFKRWIELTWVTMMTGNAKFTLKYFISFLVSAVFIFLCAANKTKVSQENYCWRLTTFSTAEMIYSWKNPQAYCLLSALWCCIACGFQTSRKALNYNSCAIDFIQLTCELAHLFGFFHSYNYNYKDLSH